MKPKMYGDMEGFAQKLRDMGYQDVRLIDTAQEAFGSHGRAAMMMLGSSRLLVAENNSLKTGGWAMSKLGVVEDTLFVPMLGRIYAVSTARKFYMIKKHWN